MQKRIRHTASFKAKVALAALKESKTLTALSQELKIHPVQIAKWKSIASERLSEIFEEKKRKKDSSEVDVETLYAQIGKLQSQLEFLKKKIGIEG